MGKEKTKKSTKLCLVLVHSRYPRPPITTNERINWFKKLKGIDVIILESLMAGQRLKIFEWLLECNIQYHQITDLNSFFDDYIFDEKTGELSSFYSDIADHRIEKLLLHHDAAMALKLRWT